MLSRERVRTDKPVRGLRFWLGLSTSVVFLALAVRKANWASVVSTLAAADPRLLAFGAVLLLGTYALFAVRWKLLLGLLPQVSTKDTFCCIMIGYIANTVLPLRLGDLARAAVMARRQRASISLVVGSVALERLLDVLALLALVLGLSFVMKIPPAIRYSMLVFAVCALIAFAVLFVVAQKGNRISRYLGSISMRHPMQLAL